MDMSLVIPVWNDPAGLDRLLQQVATLEVFSQVIVADDASDTPVGPETIPAAKALEGRVTWLRSDIQRGAGHARNMALDHITGSHVIFFDSDDLFHEDFLKIVALAAQDLAIVEQGLIDPERGPFDFLIFRHDDSRQLKQGLSGSFALEESRWTAVGAGSEATGPEVVALTREQASRLCRLSAYPWNKIYRTTFLRDNQIRCTELMVHNDLELHWSGFVAADIILACRLKGAIHFVVEDGSRLTNRRSAERLEVFTAFENVLDRITNSSHYGRLAFFQPKVEFIWNLIQWISDNIDSPYCVKLKKRAQHFFLKVLDRNRMTLLAHANPALARQIVRFVGKDYGK